MLDHFGLRVPHALESGLETPSVPSALELAFCLQ